MSQSATSSDFPAALPDVIPGLQSARRMLQVSACLLVLIMAVALNSAERLLPAVQALAARLALVDTPRAEGSSVASPPAEPPSPSPSPSPSAAASVSDAPLSNATPSDDPPSASSLPDTPLPDAPLPSADAVDDSATADTAPDPSVAGESEPLSALAALQRAELAEMADYAGRIEFGAGSAELSAPARRQLDRIFETLYLYQESSVGVRVTVPEGAGEGGRQLAGSRARALVDYLVERGLDAGRFTIDTPGGEVPYEQRSSVYFDTRTNVN